MPYTVILIWSLVSGFFLIYLLLYKHYLGLSEILVGSFMLYIISGGIAICISLAIPFDTTLKERARYDLPNIGEYSPISRSVNLSSDGGAYQYSLYYIDTVSHSIDHITIPSKYVKFYTKGDSTEEQFTRYVVVYESVLTDAFINKWAMGSLPKWQYKIYTNKGERYGSK